MARLLLLLLVLLLQKSMGQNSTPTLVSETPVPTSTDVPIVHTHVLGDVVTAQETPSPISTQGSTSDVAATSTPQVYTAVPEHLSTNVQDPSTTSSSNIISNETIASLSTTTTVTDAVPSSSITKMPSSDVSTREALNVTSNELHYANTTVTTEVKNMTEETGSDTVEDPTIYLTFAGDCDSSMTAVNSMEFVQYQVDENGGCDVVLKMLPADDDSKRMVDRMKPFIGKLLVYHNDKPWRLARLATGAKFYGGSNDTTDADQGAYIAGLSFSEFVSYVVIGCCFGTVLLATFCLLCVKCCHCRRKNDAVDVPHLSLRLEDYVLTRIPRPNTMYSETSKAHIPHDDDVSVQGQTRSRNERDDSSRMSKAYDNGVVPLDDYESARYATPTPYHRNGCQAGNELRTFRRSQEGNQLSPREMEERDSTCNNGSYGSNSTERLARDFYQRRGAPYAGEANPNYKT